MIEEIFHKLQPFLSPLQLSLLELEKDFLQMAASQNSENCFDAEIFRNQTLPLAFKLGPQHKIAFGQAFADFKTEGNPEPAWYLPLFSATGEQPHELLVYFVQEVQEPALVLKQRQLQFASSQPARRDLLYAAQFLARYPQLRGPQEKLESVPGEELSLAQKRAYFSRIITGRQPSAGLRFLEKQGLLADYLPELLAGKGLAQNRFHEFDIYDHLLHSCDAVHRADLVLRFSALLHDIGKVPTRRLKENGEASFFNHEIVSAKMVPTVLKRLGIHKETGLRIRFFVRNHMFHYTEEWSDKAVRRFLRKVPREDLEGLIALRLADRKGSGKKNAFPRALQKLITHIDEVYAQEAELKVTDLKIDGHQLMTLGVPPGPLLGKILRDLLELVKAEQVENSEEELSRQAKDLAENYLAEKPK